MSSTRLQQRLMRPCGKLNRYPAGVKAGPGKGTGAPGTLGHPSRLLTGPALTHTPPAIAGETYPGSRSLLYDHFAGHIRMNRTGV